MRPRSVSEVQDAVRAAAAAGAPVVARGAGSGLAGGAVAGEGAIVLDLSELNRIISIDPADGVARAEAGVVLADLDRAARRHGLFYAPDPGSVELATLGGSIATNAGGLRGAKYGVTRDAVLSLDVVLADSSLITVGSPTIKGVTGYDLVGLFTGSEGTLGIVVAATVRLLPVPLRTATAAAFFPTLELAAKAVGAISTSGARPSVLEVVDGPTLAAIDEAEGTGFRERGEAFLLVQTDGFGAEEEMRAIEQVVRPIASAWDWTADPERAEELLRARRQALPSIERLGELLIEDIAVPRSRLVEAIHRVREIGERTGVRIFVFGHAGDGNLHPVILVPEGANGARRERSDEAAERIFALALELGGTLTAEHGVGLLKRHWVAREVGPVVHERFTAIKRLLDPAGILNPGKAI